MTKTRFGSLLALAAGSVVLVSAVSVTPTSAQNQPFLGQLSPYGNGYCPRGWTEAAGQILPIAQNQALFSLLGTTYGGDGRTTFALPDLRARIPLGTDGSVYPLGAQGGRESVGLTVQNMPIHSHSVQATNSFSDKPGPGDKYLGADNNGVNKYNEGPPNKVMAGDMVASAGGSQPISIKRPYLATRWCIALVGVFPSRE